MTGMKTVKRNVMVNLGRRTEVDVEMTAEMEETLVVSQKLPLVSTSSTELANTIDSDDFEKLPVGEEYRDLVKLIPGVQVTANSTRGPSAGGSGQDNIYKFDGIDVSLPLFGTLSADTSAHDIDQVSIVKGGSQAVNFNRSGGFTINTISKSGTNAFKGELNYRIQPSDFEADRDDKDTVLRREEDETWLSLNVGGPLVKERLFFYASYYAPEISASNSGNVYGPQPDFDDSRDEYFVKLTFSPLDNLTLHGSYRDMQRDQKNVSIGGLSETTTAQNTENKLALTLFEGDWLISHNQTLGFKLAEFDYDTSSLPSRQLGFTPSTQLGTTIDLNNLADMGLVRLPTYGDDAALNELYRPFIEQYGYIGDNGERVGGGQVGYGSTIDRNDFSRKSWELSYNYLLVSGSWEHDLHVGFRHESADEDLGRSSNGWGAISFGNTPESFITANFLVGDGRNINSEYVTDNLELNDNITIGKWNVNIGVMLSNDKLYGQDLAEDPTAVSGYRLSPDSKYLMYETDFEDMVQPRLGVVRELRDGETIQASFGSFHPPASSLPRAASWARNIVSRLNVATFDSNGALVDVSPASSSSGKFFQPDMEPRRIDEIMLGYSRSYDNGWTAKIHSRYRWAGHFWEDTNNTARVDYADTSTDQDPEEIRSQGDYIPELGDYRAEVGGSSYVIAELDYAFTKYYEVTLDGEKRGDNYYVKGTYTWSHYYGNFDQDATSDDNDQNIFIGSSFLADAAGRQTWDNRYGNLSGDRRHLVKIFGTYQLPWGSSIGAFGIYQSGEPWETHSWEPYEAFLASWDRDDTSRYAEPAGSRTSPAHYQLDLNYTHGFRFGSRYAVELDLDIFNITDNQTERDFDKEFHRSSYGQARKLWDPRQFRLSARLTF